MPTRRSFLKQASLATAFVMVDKSAWFKKNQLIGLQLYTLREEIKKTNDIRGVLAKVAEIGYTSVELFDYSKGKFFGLTPAEFSKVISQNNLQTPSGHYGMPDYWTKGDEEQLKTTVADAAIMKHKYFTVPYLDEKWRTSLDDYKKLVEKLNKASEVVKSAGMHLAYHNHDFEFKDWGGGNGFDIFLKQTDPSLVSFEMDIYWTTKAGKDPVQLMKENPGRFKMWHVKDMDSTPEKSFTEVGSGVIDYKEIFKSKKISGMEYFFVEQDTQKIPAYQSIAQSIAYIKKNNLG